MKVLLLDGIPCMYPEGIDSIEEFIEYANENFSSFIPIIEYVTTECVYPYLVEEDVRERYVNLSLINSIMEDEVEVLTREEYDERLSELRDEICVNCTDYEEDSEGDNLKGHRNHMNLDGYCPYFEPRTDEE